MMMKYTMKYILAVILYYVGDVIGYIMNIKHCSWLYPMYSKIMLKSCELDVNAVLWKLPVDDK
jgi:hypothetical protein